MGVELGAVRLFQSQHVTGKVDNGNLHSQAKAKVRNFVFPGILRGYDFPLRAAVSETTWHKYSIQIAEVSFRAVPLNVLGIDMNNFDFAIIAYTPMND